MIAVATHVRAGYFDEPDEWVGIAHVLEHMFFKGTARRGPGDIARETQLWGGYLNASTTYDKTIYYTVLPAAQGALERALDIQGDALIAAALDPGELKRELEVVVQEAKRKLDHPAAVATETLYQLLFRVHRMRRWRIGTEEGLRRIGADDVKAYYRSRYQPARTIVSLAGDLDPEHAIRLAERTYGEWSGDEVAVPGSPLEPNGGRPAIKVLRGDIERPLGVIGWRTVAELDPDAPALDIAAGVLGAGRGSWLSRFVRTPGLAAHASASHYTPTEVGVFEASAEGDETRLDEALARTLELAERLAAEGPDEPELERVRSLISVRWSRAFEAMDGRAASLAEFEALGRYDLADRLFQRTLAVTAADVRAVARRYLNPEGASAVLYLPRSAKTRFEGAGTPWPAAPGAGERLAGRSPQIRRVGGSAGRKHPNQPTGDPPTRRPTEFRGRVAHLALSGIDLLAQPKRSSGLVSLGLYVPGVRERETTTSAGVSWLLARAALRGAGGMSADELALAAESLGGTIGASATLQALGWSITVPSHHVRKAAGLLAAVAMEPALRSDDLEIERTLQAADAARVRDDMFRHPLQQVLARAFPEDPYGLPPLGHPDRVSTLSDSLVRSWSEDLGRRRAVAVAVGDLDTERLVDGLQPFASWPGNALPEGGPRTPKFAGDVEREERDKAQSALAMAFPAAPATSERRFALEVLGSFLSGLAGRLFQTLREERSLAYTVMASPWLQRRAGAVLTYIATSPEREEEARVAMLEELARVAAGQVTAPEVERARNYAAGSVELRRQTAGSVASEILDEWLNGLIDELPNQASRLRAVNVEEVVGEAVAVFRPEARAEYLVRGRNGGKAEQ